MNVIKKVAHDMAESTRAINAINKENMAAVKADSKANFEKATAPDPGLVKVKEAKGLKAKVKQIGANIKDGCKESSKKEKERRANIQSHSAYKELLEEQRKKRQATLNQL